MLNEAEQAARQRLIDGCKAIEPNLGQAVEEAFQAGYSVEQVRAMLTTGNAINEGPPKA